MYGVSRETSDFVADAIERRHEENREKLEEEWIETLGINLDNGPTVSGSRTQFLYRMIQFAKKEKLQIELIYYPPYHSKYNPIERCRGALEQYWNGEILEDIDDVVWYTKNMTWKGSHPRVTVNHEVYESWVTFKPKEFRQYEEQLNRDPILKKWSIKINGR